MRRRPTRAPSWQGHSVAEWLGVPPSGNPFGALVAPTQEAAAARGARCSARRPGGVAAPPPTRGSLKVVTTNLRPGYLRKNGVPYSKDAVVTEYYDRFALFGNDYLQVVTVVDRSRVSHDAVRRQQSVQARARRLEVEPDAVRDRCAARHVPTRRRSDAHANGTFHEQRRALHRALCALWTLASPAAAQNDVAGDWDQAGGGIFGFQEEFLDRGGGPDLGDYAGLPINDALRYKASLYSPSWLSVPEHQCLPHPSTYQYRSPGGLSIVKEYDPVTQRLVAYRFYGSYGLARTVWMDGRPHPPANARHTYEGFSTGRWEGNRLAIETTHLKAGFLRRNGIAHSDRARMVEYFVRHDDYLTLVTAVDDPLYLDEPFVRSTDFKLDPRANARLAEFGGFVNGGDGEGFGASDVFYKCAPTEEIAIERGRVPSFMPGTNDSLDMFAKRHGVPLEAALGGSATLYPEYAARAARSAERRHDCATPRSARSGLRQAPAAAPPASVTLAARRGTGLARTGRRPQRRRASRARRRARGEPGPEEVADAVLAEIAKIAPDNASA